MSPITTRLTRFGKAAALLLVMAPFASGADPTPPLHERIAADPRDDIAMGVVLEGDIPAAIDTKSGVFSAPDPTRAPSSDEVRANQAALSQAMAGSVGDTFTPDRDTRRPDVLSYVDPFTPATAPFKRLVAFDAVDASFGLYTRYGRLRPLAVEHGQALPGEDVFYADLALDVSPDRHTRIPSVGPGARVLHAHLGSGARDLPVMLQHDGADNWFIDSGERTSARLVMELAIPRATFGGDFGDPEWSELPAMAVPDVVAAAAGPVMTHIGLGRNLRPAENVRKMVAYFRAFVDSDQPITPSKDVYTDLAMSQKGVCRHRAYAFTITALSLGIPTRMVMNEAHAWVEVSDGHAWRRVDLGGAGRMLSEESRLAEPYAAPHDAFPWPPNQNRGDDLVEKAQFGGGSSGGSSSSTTTATPTPSTGPAATVSVAVAESDATRGSTLHVRGTVATDGEACANTAVTVLLRDPKTRREARIGTVATDDKGAYASALLVPEGVPLGDYDVVARTEGGAHCGQGVSP